MNPIGIFHSSAQFKSEAPRQGVFEEIREGQVILRAGENFEQALRDLDGFDRIWLLYLFDRNSNWRPTTRPPIPPAHADRVGVFASRSPYRPNPIGLSCVRLLGIQGLKLIVSEADLLDQTPILDIKPYIPQFDSFPEAKAGWLENQHRECWEIECTPLCMEQAQWVQKQCGLDLLHFAQLHLRHDPFDDTRKRVQIHERTGSLAHRTWRILFELNREQKSLSLLSIGSGYSLQELNDSLDLYADKEIHRQFKSEWP